MDLHHRSCLVIVAVFFGVLSLIENAQADSYDVGFARAHSLEAQGNVVGAAAELEKLLPEYPQDYAVAVHAGWYYSLAGRHRDSERMYRQAAARAPLAVDAHLGLAWVLALQQKCREADAEWSRVLGLDPDNTHAKAGLHACEKAAAARTAKLAAERWTLTALALTAHEYAYIDHPHKRSGTGGAVSARLWSNDGVTAGVLFRYTRFETVAPIPAFSQNEVYVGVGVERPAYGVALHGAVLREDTDGIGPSAHAGVSGYVRYAGELCGALSFSHYELLDYARFEPAWRIKITDQLRIVPAAAFGVSAAETTANGMLGILLDFPILSIWGGGKYGPEVRPAYLPQMVVYATTDRISWGAWSGLRAHLARWLNAELSYSLDRVDVATESGSQSGFLHAVALTASVVL